MDFVLTPAQRELQARARRFAMDVVRPRSRELDRLEDPRAAYCEALLRQASEAGLRTLKIPRQYGGEEIDALTEVIVFEELCAGDVGFGTTIAHPWREGLMLATATTDEQRRRFLPRFMEDPAFMTSLCITEPHAGSDHNTPYFGSIEAGVATTAELRGDAWYLNGRKSFITGGNVSKVLIVLARTNTAVPWPQGVTAFIVPSDTPGFRVRRVLDKLGIRANPNADLEFVDCRVPRENVLGEINGGLDVLRRYAGGSKTKEAVKSLGIARAAWEEAVTWARQRVQGGKKLIEHQVNAHALAEMATQIEIARTFIWRAAWAVDHDSSSARRLEAMAKTFTTEMAVGVTTRCLELFGGYGILRENLIEKLVRDAVSMPHAFVGNQAMRENLSRDLFSQSA